MKKKILVVDDEPDIAKGIRDFLEEHDYEVLIVHDGLQGLETARRVNPDLILMDVFMPGLTGVQLAEELQAQGHRGPIIVMSARSGTRELFENRKGFAFLNKPFNQNQLLEKIHSLLA